MTGIGLVALIVMAVLAIVACRNIGEAKGLEGQAAWGLLGVGGLVYVALRKPTVGGGPEHDDMSPLAWMRGNGLPWTQRHDWLAGSGAAVALVVGVALSVHSGGGNLDSQALNAQLESWLSDNGEPATSVNCPSAPMKAGYVFLCTVDGSPDVGHIRVTVDNSSGDVEWEAVG